MAALQNTVTLQVKVGVSPLGASAEEVKEAVEAAIQNLRVCPQAYNTKVELIGEKEEMV